MKCTKEDHLVEVLDIFHHNNFLIEYQIFAMNHCLYISQNFHSFVLIKHILNNPSSS